jgi:transcriptional regulator GlxA family with amidase domain
MEEQFEQAVEAVTLTNFAERLADLLERASLDFERDRRAARHTLSIAYSLAREQAPAKSRSGHARQSGGLSGWQVKRIRDFIDERLEAPIQINELRDLTQLSTGHFFRAFKQAFHQTPHRYLMARRVERAREMMIDTTESLASISLACGFTDQAHLSKLFKTEFRQSPSAWRRSLHEPF